LALVRRPRDIQHWHGPYLKSEAVIPSDPWGNPYIYKCPGRHNRNSYDLYSMGPDGREGTDDDVTNWQSQKGFMASRACLHVGRVDAGDGDADHRGRRGAPVAKGLFSRAHTGFGGPPVSFANAVWPKPGGVRRYADDAVDRRQTGSL